jgi:hypothetical protein
VLAPLLTAQLPAASCILIALLLSVSGSVWVQPLLLLLLGADLLADLGMPLHGEALALALAQLDQQQTGTVSFGQFLLWWKE